MRILTIEDDAQTLALLVSGLEGAGHTVTRARDGHEGLAQASAASHDVLIVDRMLPGRDGLDLVRTLRRSGIHTPVLFLTTMSGIDDRVEGLEAGGDDYLVKPFALAELLARVHALGRRASRASGTTVLRAADLEMDLIARTVRRAGRAIELQPREFALLEFLMRNADLVVTRRQLLENVWDFHFDPRTNIVETHMSRLRAKLDDVGGSLIQTVRGAGYVLHATRP
jgi:two-component system, OmpR family, response regulator